MIGPRRASLTGRVAELAALARAAAQAREGRGGMVLVFGEAGIGKSRLISELTASLDGAVVLHGQAYSGDDVVDNVILVDTLRNARRTAHHELWTAAQRRARVLGAVIPELLDDGTHAAAVHDANQVFESVLDAVAEHAGGRLTVWVAEDVHWADAASWRFLHVCARRAAAMPLLVVLTFRDDEKPPDDGAWSRLVSGTRDRVVRIPLRRLAAAETARIARELLSDAPDVVVDAVVRRSCGTPLLIEELTAMGDVPSGASTAVPEVIVATARERMRAAGEASLGFLRLAAVMGHDADLDLLLDLRPDQAAAVEPLVAAGLLRTATDPDRPSVVEFRHPLLREAVYADIPWEQRRMLHAEAAEALTAHTSTQSAERVAQHWEQAGRTGDALDCLLGVIAQARAQSNLLRAISLGLLALHMVERHDRLSNRRAEVVEPLVNDLVAQGRWEDARPLLAQAVAAAAPGTPARTLLVAQQLITEWFLGSPADSLMRTLDAELAGVVDAESRGAALLYTVAGLMLHGMGDVERSATLSEVGRRAAVACGDLDIETRASIYLSWVRLPDMRMRRGIVEQMRELAERLTAAGLHGRAAILVLQIARITLDPTDLDAAVAIGTAWNPWSGLGARLAVAHVDVLAGRWDAGAAGIDEVARNVDEVSIAFWSVTIARVAAALMQGRIEDAERGVHHIDTAFGRATTTAAEGADTSFVHGWLAWTRNDMHSAATRFATALDLTEVARIEPGFCGPYFVPLLVDAHLRLGDRVAAEHTLARVVERERHPDMDRYTAAGLAAAELRAQPSPERVRAALDACNVAEWPWLAGLCSYWAAELIGDPLSARIARDTWQRLGYGPGVARAQQLIDDLNRRSRGRLLTAREETVAELIAEGLTNAQIALRLGISPVTVAHHVSSVLNKLDVGSRTQVAVLFARSRLAP